MICIWLGELCSNFVPLVALTFRLPLNMDILTLRIIQGLVVHVVIRTSNDQEDLVHATPVACLNHLATAFYDARLHITSGKPQKT
jgi:hypothetical protein